MKKSPGIRIKISTCLIALTILSTISSSAKEADSVGSIRMSETIPHLGFTYQDIDADIFPVFQQGQTFVLDKNMVLEDRYRYPSDSVDLVKTWFTQEQFTESVSKTIALKIIAILTPHVKDLEHLNEILTSLKSDSKNAEATAVYENMDTNLMRQLKYIDNYMTGLRDLTNGNNPLVQFKKQIGDALDRGASLSELHNLEDNYGTAAEGLFSATDMLLSSESILSQDYHRDNDKQCWLPIRAGMTIAELQFVVSGAQNDQRPLCYRQSKTLGILRKEGLKYDPLNRVLTSSYRSHTYYAGTFGFEAVYGGYSTGPDLDDENEFADTYKLIDSEIAKSNSRR